MFTEYFHIIKFCEARSFEQYFITFKVSMLGPSPDWIVGVSGLEMCRANCSWVENKELFLYPWDAGVDSGISYESPDSPSEPKMPITRYDAPYLKLFYLYSIKKWYRKIFNCKTI